MNKHTHMQRTHAQALPKQSGVTLVELMIAMLIGLFLIGGVLQVFSSARQTYRVQDATSRMQESGRMALEVLSRDIRIAGFWGCVSNRTRLVDNLDSDGADYVDYLGGGIAGIEGNADPDTLTVRSGIDVGIVVESPFGPAASSEIKSTTATCWHKVTSSWFPTAPEAISSRSRLKMAPTSLSMRPGAARRAMSTLPTRLAPGPMRTVLRKTYGGDAKVLMTQQVIYTIAEGSEGQPALFRELDGINAEFVDGIENLQVLYGEDIDGSLTANYFVPADEVVDMLNVVSVRIAVVARSYDDNLSGGISQNYSVLGTNMVAADSRLRQVYSSTVAVRNRL